jgi:general stress protein 26
MVKHDDDVGKTRGIMLPGSQSTQLISQFANDTSFTIEAGKRENVTTLVATLNLFNSASGLELHWNKSLAFWYSKNLRPP